MNGTPMMQHNKQHFENIQQFHSESGRSLVEMLGTLAVMGVLTIAGIAGFNYAMNKQRANATIGYVNELAVLGTGQMLAGGTPKLLDYPDHTPSGYPVGISTDSEKPNVFYVDIKEVPTPICEEMVSRLDGWKMVNDIGFFDKVGACSDKKKVDMWFEIIATATKDDMPPQRCQTDADCKQWYLQNGKCNSKGICELVCPKGYTKTPVGCCLNTRVFNGGCCGVDLIEENGVKKCCGRYGFDSNPQCCPEGTFPYKNNQCVSCDDPNANYYFGHWGYCQMCPNRVVNGAFGCALQCADPDAKPVNRQCHCPPDRPLAGRNEDGKCYPCNTPPGVSVTWNGTTLLDKYSEDTKQTAHYCNRRNWGGWSSYCEPGTVGISWVDEIILADGTLKKTNSASEATCMPCEQVMVSKLKYQAQCESCGWKWVGVNWHTGSCEPKN